MTEPDRSRLRRDQLKTLVLDAGLELLHEDGLGAKTAPIGYADAFRWLEEHRSLTVSRAQVHRRIWNSLAEYRQDVLVDMVRQGWPGDVLDKTASEITEALDQMDIVSADAESRLELLFALARRQTDRNAELLRTRRSIAAADAVFAMHSLGTADKPGSLAVRTAIIESKTEILDRYIDLYSRVSELVGASIDPTLGLADGMRVYAEVLSCLNQGAGGRSTFEPVLQEIPIGGEVWSVEGLCVYAVTGHVATIDGPRAQQDEGSVADPLVTKSNKVGGAAQTKGDDDTGAGGRMERDTLRRHMIRAGREVLLERGFGHGAEQITYGRVFERIKERQGITVARAQVHRRIWSSQNQFQLELLAAAARPGVTVGLDRAAEIAARTLAEVDLSSPANARAAAARVVRAIAHGTAGEFTSSQSWLLGRAIMSFHALNRDRSVEVGQALHQEYENGISNWAELFEALAVALGYRARPWTECSLREVCVILARCADVLSEGVIARTRMMGDSLPFQATIAGNEAQDWNILGLGSWCVIDLLMEPAS